MNKPKHRKWIVESPLAGVCCRVYRRRDAFAVVPMILGRRQVLGWRRVVPGFYAYAVRNDVLEPANNGVWLVYTRYGLRRKRAQLLEQLASEHTITPRTAAAVSDGV